MKRKTYLVMYGTDLDDMDYKAFGTRKRAEWWIGSHAQHFDKTFEASLYQLSNKDVFECRAKEGGIWTRYTIKALDIE